MEVARKSICCVNTENALSTMRDLTWDKEAKAA